MPVRIIHRVGRRVERLTRRLKQAFGLPIRHGYPGFTILLPAEHLLPVYQRDHPCYDRFLPHLAAALGADATIIDVGANCGDTLAGMITRNPRARYICIEPDPQFFAYLQRNIARMQASLGTLSVHAVQSLVGRTSGAVTLAGGGGTRHAIAATSAAPGLCQATLDSILATLPPRRIDLLKSDIDGFDYDVLDSAEALLTTQRPLLFFETYCENQLQLAGFIRTIGWLETLGYRHWAAFDNFGTMLLRTCDADSIRQLLDYIWKQHGAATRTIYYLDVLVWTDAQTATIETVLDGY